MTIEELWQNINEKIDEKFIVVDKILNLIEGIQKQIGKMQNQIDGMQSQIDEINNKIDGLQNQIDEINNKIVEMNNKIDGMQNHIDYMDNKIDVLDEKYDNVSEEIRKINNKIDISLNSNMAQILKYQVEMKKELTEKMDKYCLQNNVEHRHFDYKFAQLEIKN